MMDMARLTGGRAYFNNNDVPGRDSGAVKSNSSYYALAYRPQNAELEWNFRKVTVKSPNRTRSSMPPGLLRCCRSVCFPRY